MLQEGTRAELLNFDASDYTPLSVKIRAPDWIFTMGKGLILRKHAQMVYSALVNLRRTTMVYVREMLHLAGRNYTSQTKPIPVKIDV